MLEETTGPCLWEVIISSIIMDKIIAIQLSKVLDLMEKIAEYYDSLGNEILTYWMQARFMSDMHVHKSLLTQESISYTILETDHFWISVVMNWKWILLIGKIGVTFPERYALLFIFVNIMLIQVRNYNNMVIIHTFGNVFWWFKMKCNIVLQKKLELHLCPQLQDVPQQTNSIDCGVFVSQVSIWTYTYS